MWLKKLYFKLENIFPHQRAEGGFNQNSLYPYEIKDWHIIPLIISTSKWVSQSMQLPSSLAIQFYLMKVYLTSISSQKINPGGTL